MKWILIGHRGVGKSQLLTRLKTYLPDSDLAYIDLDQTIEKKFQKPLIQLFPEIGEAQFRQIEQETFIQIDQQNSNYILSVGAGFSCHQIPAGARVIWVRRPTDELGRIFLNRPRLNSQISSLEEFIERFSKRQISYETAADEVYCMPEGIETAHPIEEKIFHQQNISALGILTLRPGHLKSSNPPCLRYGCDFYEFRDDLLSIENDNWNRIPQQNRLLSFRDEKKVQSSLSFLSKAAQSDWALELGPCVSSDISILSCHNYLPNESLTQFLSRLEQAARTHQHLKAAPIIKNYLELQELMKWQEKNPSMRSILPRSDGSEKGRWTWVRLYLKGRQKINFWRDSDGSAPDQPTLFEWLSTPNCPEHFAALLGNPVGHSRTMLEQSEFFSKMNWPIWAILLQESEFSLAFKFLASKGLKAAAVTSPLKIQAHQISQIRTTEANELQAVNTLWVSDPTDAQLVIYGHNTDLQGLQKLIQEAAHRLQIPVSNLTAVVWGGGGTLSTLQKIIPQATQLSVRSGQPRNPKEKIPDHVHLLIWAASPKDSFPLDFEFDLIVDLNYREDSMARELALSKGKPYLGGDLMFKEQAAGQRRHWNLLVPAGFNI